MAGSEGHRKDVLDAATRGREDDLFVHNAISLTAGKRGNILLASQFTPWVLEISTRGMQVCHSSRSAWLLPNL